MKRFWKWLIEFSNKKYRECHLNEYHNDIKCPNCNEWFSLSGIHYNHEAVSEPDFGFHVKCGKCKAESYWNAVAAPVILRCDESGNPL